MTSSRASPEDLVSSAWTNAMQEGHRCLRIAEKLLSRPWVAPCPLPTDSGARQQPPADEYERFTDLLVIALHWAGSPDTSPSSALLVIPESAGHGIADTVPREMECYQPDGEAAGTTSVVVVLATAEYLARILYESTPVDTEAVTFIPDLPNASPIGASVFASLSLPEPL
eukprot:3947214-Amphidinium_carterae.2